VSNDTDMDENNSFAPVEARGLRRSFGDKVAVDHLDLRVEAGTFFGFLGPNGAGKTTTLRMLTGLLQPTSGEARICGLPVLPGETAFRRKMGVVPEGLALFDRLSLRENIELAGRLQDLPKDETAQRASDLLTFLDLANAAEVHAVDGSHGMRKKTALAMALIHSPRVLFLDEPFAGLDPIASRTVRRLLERLAGKGVTVFLTSHVLEIVERLCTRIAILSEGRVAFDGSREELTKDGSLEERFAELAGEAGEEPELPWLG
jgi:ABC-2 type transport system ATP-binding protein